jgi:hypothetical protein
MDLRVDDQHGVSPRFPLLAADATPDPPPPGSPAPRFRLSSAQHLPVIIKRLYPFDAERYKWRNVIEHISHRIKGAAPSPCATTSSPATSSLDCTRRCSALLMLLILHLEVMLRVAE